MWVAYFGMWKCMPVFFAIAEHVREWEWDEQHHQADM